MSNTCLEGDVRPFLDGDRPVHDLTHYYSGADTPSGYRFSGAAFDIFGRGGDDPDRFRAEDLLALAFLSVPAEGHAALAILGQQADELNGLLAEVPADVDLWDVDADLVDDGSPASQLWERLTALPKFGFVSANKLLAAKAPTAPSRLRQRGEASAAAQRERLLAPAAARAPRRVPAVTSGRGPNRRRTARLTLAAASSRCGGVDAEPGRQRRPASVQSVPQPLRRLPPEGWSTGTARSVPAVPPARSSCPAGG